MQKITTKNNLFTILTTLSAALLTISVNARELPGDWPTGLQLGSAYDSSRHQEFMAACVEGPKVDISFSKGDIKYTSEASFERIANAFSGSLSAGVKAPFVKVSASMEYARENAKTDTRMNWFFEFNAIRQSQSFDVSKLKVSSYGNDALKAGYAAIPDWCGDEFVSKIDYGASLIGTMSIEFASKEDKEEFKLAAALDVNFMTGKAQANGKLQKMQQKMGSRTIVKVEAHQTGGNPGQLNGILGSGQIVRCTLADMDNCLSAFENILRYANGDFKQQLTKASGYSVIRYTTTAYKDSVARKFVPPTGFPLLDKMVIKQRELIEKSFKKESKAYTRANYITTKLAPFTPAPQLLAVKGIRNKSWANMVLLTEGMETCLKFPQKCLKQALSLETYDPDDLDLKIEEQLDPNSNLGKLHNSVKIDDENASYLALQLGGNGLITQCDLQGFNACHRAVEQGRTTHLRLFIQKNPHKNDSKKSAVHAPCDNPTGYTPMCLAAKGGTYKHVECINLLCQAGASVDCKTLNGMTPLQVAVRYGKLETVRDLVGRGANQKIIDVQKRNLLHLACEGGDVLIIKYLIDDLKFGISVEDREGLTPLHWASRAGNREAVNLLIGYGACPQHKDREGRTPLDWGVKYEDIVMALLPHSSLVMNPQEIHDHGPDCRYTSISPDGSKYALCFSDDIQIRSAQTGKHILSFTLSGLRRFSWTPFFSFDGSMLARVDDSGRIHVWELKTGTLRHVLQTAYAMDLSFNPNGLELVSAGLDNNVKIWDLHTGALLKTYEHQNVSRISLNPDNSGPSYFVGSSHLALISEWGPWGYVKTEDISIPHTILHISFSPDGSMLAIAKGDGSINVCDAYMKPICFIPGQPKKTLEHTTFSRDGSILASSSEDKTIKFWNIPTGEHLYTIESDDNRANLSFYPDDSGFAMVNMTTMKRLNLRWDSLLHKAVRGENSQVVPLIVKKFPLLLHIRTPQGQLPHELAEELLAQKGNNATQALRQIVDYLRSQKDSRFPKKKVQYAP